MMVKKLLFSCYHCYLDPSNGASITAREILLALSKLGWEIQTFTGPGLDFRHKEHFSQIIADHGISDAQTLTNISGIAGQSFELFSFSDNGIRSTLFVPQTDTRVPSESTGRTFLHLLRRAIANFKPNIMMTYGGFWLGPLMLKLAHTEKIKTSALIQNLAYRHKKYFRNIDQVIVPSQFAADHYAQTLGLCSVPIAPIMKKEAFSWSSDTSARHYATLVNPEPGKGLYWFLRMAKTLARIRPDIPLLMVEARGNVRRLANVGTMLKHIKSLHVMQNTPCPGDFYRVSKVIVVPSYYEETFGRVAAEAMMAGIPVIGAHRGALPEVLGDAGVLLNIPTHYTPQTTAIPSSEEVRPWTEALVRLWDDQEYYENISRRCQERAHRWHPDEIAKLYCTHLSKLIE